MLLRRPTLQDPTQLLRQFAIRDPDNMCRQNATPQTPTFFIEPREPSLPTYVCRRWNPGGTLKHPRPITTPERLFMTLELEARAVLLLRRPDRGGGET